LLLMAIVPHLLGHGALNWAVRHLPAYLVSLTALGEPILATLYAFLLFGEVPAPLIYPGALLIGTGVFLAMRIETRRETTEGAL
jgi:drug/metabolite transporter (DMT)-like permease